MEVTLEGWLEARCKSPPADAYRKPRSDVSRLCL